MRGRRAPDDVVADGRGDLPGVEDGHGVVGALRQLDDGGRRQQGPGAARHPGRVVRPAASRDEHQGRRGQPGEPIP
jgi:hypothetical protein